MADASSSDRPATATCPWCSAAIAEDVTVCPSCGASLVSDGEPDVPGVTTVAAKPIMTQKATSQPRNRLLSWISGEYPSDLSRAEVEAVAPPDQEVRREMRRLELEAEVARLRAEADLIRADAAAAGRTIDPADGAEPGEAEAPSGSEPAAGGEEPAEDRPPA
jgi:hypothetical protein